MTLSVSESVIFSLYKKRRLLLYEASPFDSLFSKLWIFVQLSAMVLSSGNKHHSLKAYDLMFTELIDLLAFVL